MDLTDDDRRVLRRVANSVGRARWVPREDLVQEAEIRLWRTPECEAAVRDRSGFVAVVARRAMLDWLRGTFLRSRTREGRRQARVAKGGDAELHGFYYGDERSLDERRVDWNWNAIDARLDSEVYLRRYPRRTRQAMRLRYLEGLPVKECAERMGVTENGYHFILKHGSERRLYEPSMGSLFVDPNAPIPPKRTARKPADLRALVADMDAFLDSLSPVVRADTREWLDGASFEDLAARHGVKVQSARNSIARAFARVYEQRHSAAGAST